MAVYWGLDLSLRNTGIVIGNARRPASDLLYNLWQLPKGVVGPARLAWLYEQLGDVIADERPRAAVIEGYSMSSKGRVFDIAEWGGIVRWSLHDNNIPFMIVAPSTLKKFAVGHGGGKKDPPLMRQQFAKFMEIDIEEVPEDDNLIDAGWLWAAGVATWERNSLPRSCSAVQRAALLDMDLHGVLGPAKTAIR